MTSENTVHRHPILTSELQILQTYISCNLANHRCFPWLKMTFLPFCITSSSCHYTGVSNGRPKVGGRKRNTLIWSDFIFIRELSLGLSIEIKRGIIFPPDIQLVYPCFTPCFEVDSIFMVWKLQQPLKIKLEKQEIYTFVLTCFMYFSQHLDSISEYLWIVLFKCLGYSYHQRVV